MQAQWGLKSVLAILATMLPMAAGLASASAASIPPEIEDPQCLGINKEPWHATLMPYQLYTTFDILGPKASHAVAKSVMRRSPTHRGCGPGGASVARLL